MAPLKRGVGAISNAGSGSDEESLDMYDASDAASDASQQAARKRARLLKRPQIRQDTPMQNGDEDDDENEASSDDEEYEQQATQAIERQRARRRDVKVPDCGILRSVRVINFMCHKNLLYELGPFINFIVGPNGSGKSAILTALTLCLGGKASSTNRGQNLKGLIKEGEDSATIIVSIKNEGDGAYMPEEYGNTIIVERHFSKSGTSGFKLKSEKGRIVSTRRVDLDEISDYFALQIDNPMNVLNQDLSREFITSSSPQDKYRFFIRGVQLEQLDQDYRILGEAIANIGKRLDMRRDDIKDLEDRKEKAKVRLQLSDKHESYRERVRKYWRQMAWAQVEDQERIVTAFDTQLRTADQKIAEAEAQTAQYETAFDTAHTATLKAAEVEERAKQEVEEVEEQLSATRAEHDTAKKELSEIQGQQRQIRDALTSANKTISAKEIEITEERQRLEDLHGGSHARKLEELDRLKQIADTAHETESQHLSGRDSLDAARKEAEQEVPKRLVDIKPKEDEVFRAEGVLQSLLRDRGSQSMGFPDKMPILLREIGRENSFSQKPIGPVGNHVRLLKPEWSSQLEKAFGATLTSFIVTSKRDMEILSRIMKRVNCECQIFIGSNQQLDITAHEPDESFDTALRALTIDNDLVRKQLIIQHGIEQTLLIPDLERASEIMFGPNRPQNVRRCYCINPQDRRSGFHLTYTRNGEASQDPIAKYQGKPRMKTDIEVQINLQRDAVAALKRELRALEEAHRTAEIHVKNCKQAVERHKREITRLKIESQRADDAVEVLKDEIARDSTDDGRLRVLEAALQEAKESKAVNEGSFQDSVNAMDQSKQKLLAERNKVREVESKRDAMLQNLKKLEEHSQRLAVKRSEALGEKNAAFNKVGDAKSDRAILEGKRQEVVERVASYTEKASQICARVNVDPGETTDSLDKKIDKLQKDLDRLNRQAGGTREEIAADAAQTLETWQGAVKSVQNMEGLAQRLNQSLGQRKERWLRFRGSISARARIQFKHLLSERSFRGEVLTDHKRKLLDVRVEPDITKAKASGRGAKTLSGGEKSFSQICLLLSIWEAMGSPIRCLDEFDVFMDSVNRKMSIDLLLSAARRSAGRQFIFISPGSKSDYQVTPDINVRELRRPERGQTTLSFNV